MLAQRRSLILDGIEVERTPLLVPSFSSKGFPDVSKIVEACSELIEGPTLFSAYDLAFKKISPPFEFPSLIFLDSGGYEASKDLDLSELGDNDHQPRHWSREIHEEVLKDWNPSMPSVLISYDNPKDRTSYSEQISRALAMSNGKTGFMREILLKPEKETQAYVKIEEIVKHVHKLAEFDVIGVTEKEIGNSVLERMINIAKLRRALTSVNLRTPIHVFGSLDTISTPLYFLAGADIFDGLTWLRFAYYQGQTIYKHNFGALKLGTSTKAHVVDARCWHENYYYMREMELEMRTFLSQGDFGSFKHNNDLFRRSLQATLEAIGEK